jgi:diacylglycerol O-acyltransferase / wax synthase
MASFSPARNQPPPDSAPLASQRLDLCHTAGMGTWFERLSSLDSLFLELEDRTAHMHVGAVAVFEGKAPPYRDVLQLVEARLHQVPRYRQRVQFVPFKQGRPVWIDESQFDLEYHVRHTALPAPGGDEELKRLAGRLFSQALDRDKPLWELWLVEGLGGDGSAGDGRTPKAGASGDRFAIISKTHHCMLDGISGVDLATVLLDSEPSTEAPAAPAEWKPRPAPKASELFATSLKEQITNPIQVVREALQSNNDARKLLREIAGGVKPLLGLAGMGLAPASALNRPIGPHRRFEMFDLPLPEIRKIRRGLRGTLNDVILAVVAGALRRWLEAKGESLGPDLRALVPVSMRGAHDRNTFGNQVSAVFCPLPVAEANPVERLRKVREAMKGIKEGGQAVAAAALASLSDFAPPTLLAQAARLQAVTRFFNLVITNVPGPQFPLYLLGRQLLGCYPQVPLAAQQSIGVALLSYHGNVCVGLLADLDVRDVAALGDAMRASLDELLAATEAAPGPEAPQAPAVSSREPRAAVREAIPADPARTPGI